MATATQPTNTKTKGKATRREIRPQPGPQTAFLSTPADIAIYGGAAGGGKTFALLMEPLRHIQIPDFEAVIFRRTSEQITKSGGLWKESKKLYPYAGGKPNETYLRWKFKSGATIAFGHIQYEKDLSSWDSTQIAVELFDQLESFTEDIFFYMLSRNRSTCGVRPYIRATCNPVSRRHKVGGWLNGFVSWWINQDTGLPILERSGVVRWMVRIERDIYWHDSREAAVAFCLKRGIREATAEKLPLSVTFIPAKLEDNQILMEEDPGYETKLLSMNKHERDRLLFGNWNERPEGGEWPLEWIEGKYFEKWPTDAGTVCKVMALDPSKGKSDKMGDYQALIKLVVGTDNCLYVQANMKRRPVDQMVADAVGIYREFAPHGFCLEGNAWQDLLAPDFEQEFERQGILAPPLSLVHNHTNKEVRIRQLGAYLAHDRIRFKADCPDTQILIDQLLDFPEGQHDDGPDALEMAIRLAKQLVNGE